MQSSAEVERRKDIQMSVREALHSKKGGSSKDHEMSSPGANDRSDEDDDEATFDARMRMQILKKRNELGGTSEKISNSNLFPLFICLIFLHLKNIFHVNNILCFYIIIMFS